MSVPYPMPFVPPRAPRPLRVNTGAGALAATFIVLAAVTDLVLTWSVWKAYQVVMDYLDGAATVADLENADRLTTVANLLQLLLTLAAALAFLPWLYRARLNSEVLSPAEHRHKRGWVIGGWFCPILNFFFPQHIVTDIWRASRPDAGQVTEIGRLPSSRLVTWWWLLLLIPTLLNRYVVSVQLPNILSPEDLRDALWLLTVDSVGRLASAVLILLIIKRVNEWQRAPRPEPVPPEPAG
ncbi:DUF4328 domain-containing protein [Amycolatopsis acidicola]|uniref:DUF4328 domain-containing protein n=1 Tax=Amycolatopsis acidicola TaxID=2596893 RepID=A0A5N0USN4_9PSEU|nr:DUF4328 domain-containing protein [Amycolatopsis acidicola]KAA9150949.1 DUF4328 domain-containing protein [Amycolatopsis acidicola]